MSIHFTLQLSQTHKLYFYEGLWKNSSTVERRSVFFSPEVEDGKLDPDVIEGNVETVGEEEKKLFLD